MKSTMEQLQEQLAERRQHLIRLEKIMAMDPTVVVQTFEIDEMYKRIKSSLEFHQSDPLPHLKFFGYCEDQLHYTVHRLIHLTEEDATAKPWRFRSKDHNDLQRHLLLMNLYDSYTYYEKNEEGEDIIDFDFLVIMDDFSRRLMGRDNPIESAA